MKFRIGFSTTNSFWSNLIRMFTKSHVSHVYIRLEDDFLGTQLVIHADWLGVCIDYLDTFKQLNKIIVEYEIEHPDFEKVIKQNFKFLGKKYDYSLLLSHVWFIVFKRWFQRKVKNPLVDPTKIICVDFVLRILNELEVTNLPYKLLYPRTLLEFIDDIHEKQNWRKIEHK
jgi:hypothetical protein